MRRLRGPAGDGSGRDGTPQADQLLERLDAATRLLADAAETFANAEWELVVLAGRQLLGDEARPD